MRKIMFPKAEKSDIKKKLRLGEEVMATRVFRDVGKFKVGERLEYGGYFLRVARIESFEKLEEHPFLDELEDKMKSSIKRFGKFEVLWLEVSE